VHCSLVYTNGPPKNRSFLNVFKGFCSAQNVHLEDTAKRKNQALWSLQGDVVYYVFSKKNLVYIDTP
jgi:hypothetical protein